MSTLKVNNLQVGQDGTAANNYTLYQPASPDGTVRLGYGVAGSVTDILTLKNSRLGIGTDNPGSILHTKTSGGEGLRIQGTSTNAFMRFVDESNNSTAYFGHDTTFSIVNQRNTDMRFLTNDLQRLCIDANGRILTGGITSGRGGAYTQHIFNIPSNKYYFEIRSTADDPGFGDILFSDGSSGDYGIVGYDHTTNALRFHANSDERMRISGNGNVGINQISPSEKLEIYAGDILLSGNANGVSGGIGPDAALKFEYNGHQYAKIVGNGRDSSGYGDIDFYTSSSAGVTNLTQRMTIRADGKVGIGTDTPAARVHVHAPGSDLSTIRLSGTAANQVTYDIRQGILGVNNAGFSIRDITNSATRFVISHTGDVGVGTDAPSKRLTISNGSSDEDIISMSNDEVGINLGAWGAGSTYPRETTINGTRFDSGTSPFLRIGGQGGIKFCADLNNERMRITPTGQINIGNNLGQQNYLFSVSAAGSAGASPVIFENSVVGHYGGLIIKAGVIDRECRLQSSFGSSFMTFYTEGTQLDERLRIGSNGSVYIGKTSTSRDTNGFAYSVGTNNDDGTLILANGRTSGGSALEINRINSDGNAISFFRANTAEGTIVVSTSGTTYNTTSDIRLKTDIRPILDATDKLMNMNPVTHKWKEDPDGDTVHGFIAQEMQKISPESVHGKPDDEMMMGMDYGRITPIIVAALQDAIEEINTLKQRISKLGG